MWRWLREWRERRAALRELNETIEETDARLADWADNPFLLAKAALDVGNVEKAVAQWEEARLLMPNVVLKSQETLEFLMTLKRYEEAEDLMREGRRRFPRDIFYVTAPAFIAQHQHDLALAAERWADVRAYDKSVSEGYWRGAICMRLLDRIDEAEALARQGIRVRPVEVFSRLEYARCAEHRRDWPEAVKRWRQAVDFLPDQPAPAAGLGRLLIELERYDEAEAWLSEAKQKFDRDIEVLTVDVLCAERRGDVDAALQRWSSIRNLFRSLPLAYPPCARLLTNAGRHAEADAVLLDAVGRFRDVPWAAVEYARLAHERQDWSEASARWAAVRERFPQEYTAHALGQIATRNAEQEAAVPREN
jgi:tetratricopeptide (TPR) repeat protein